MKSLLEQSDAARREGRRWRRIRNLFLLVVFLAFILWGAIRYYYPWEEGVVSGKLNHVVYQGLVFKTYEGKLILSGVHLPDTGGVRSNEFVFSIAKRPVAEKLMHAGGKTVELHYTEYFAAIPWRGYSRYVVDEIIRITDAPAMPEETDTIVRTTEISTRK
jgi:hypothetical protein